MSVTYPFNDDLMRLHHDSDYTTDDVRQTLLALADPLSYKPKTIFDMIFR